jgi:ATP-dependent DNA helicase RecG
MVQLLVALRRYLFRVSHSAKPFLQPAEKTKKFIRSLPFEFTEAQRRVLRDIWNDLKSDIPMRRLLQGDVGSGKTVVAFTAMLYSVENGFQAVLMAPTEILAEQHYLLAKKYFERLGINLTILKGSQKQSARKEAYEDIRKGNTGIIIGTHALIQKEVEFNNLGLVVIDEQHRFGVMQRQELITKGVHPHVLVMTATPIPRTLTMTLYGDLDVSVIDEIPAGRKRIKTVVRREEALDDIYNFLAGEISSVIQAYIVYPLIEESEKIDLEAAVKGYELIKKRFKNQTVGMVHGRMKVGEKEEVMNRFAAGDIKVLVATTVIEVGIDVPNASVMLIQNAERFGLSQLHQLRGRVGRGEYQSYCILIRSGKITEEGEMRLKAMSETIDGFKIAEIDLQIRGTGEFFGTRQSGFDDLKIANLIKDKKILTYARTEAFNLIQEDPELKKPENNHLKKVFLYKYRDKLQEMKLH